jgi:hypothetical protein
MVSAKPELAKDLRSLLTKGQNVRCVLTERAGHKLDVANELLVSEEPWAERASEREVRVKDLR